MLFLRKFGTKTIPADGTNVTSALRSRRHGGNGSSGHWTDEMARNVQRVREPTGSFTEAGILTVASLDRKWRRCRDLEEM
jgi:hypothetical protein